MTPETHRKPAALEPEALLSYDESLLLEPDTARAYERASPIKEYGDERLDLAHAPPARAPDQMIRAVHNAHESHQLNSDAACDAGASCPID